MRDFRRLTVWCQAHALTLLAYRITRTVPNEELYGLTSQIRRSAASVAANIAEGCGRRGPRELAHFLYIALGSASELQYHLILAADLELVDRTNGARLEAGVTDVKRMLSGLIKKLSEDE